MEKAGVPRKKVYFVWNYLNWGGAQIYFLSIMKAAGSDWDVTVLLPIGSSEEFLGFLSELGIRVEFLKHALDTSTASTFKQKILRQRNRIRSEKEIYSRLKQIDVENSVIHIDIAPWQSWQLFLFLAARGAKVFITLHNFLEGGSVLRRAIWKLRLLLVTALPGVNIFASNLDAKTRFQEWIDNGFFESVKVTYTTVDPELIDSALRSDRALLREGHSISDGDFVVLCVGQFIDRKGRWIFLEAAKKALEQNENLKFVWVMPQLPQKPELEKIETFGLNDRFETVLSSSIGKNRIDVLSFFRIADAFALPSYVEGLPISLLEAMALGIPSISTNVYAIPEAVIDRETGLLISAGDSDALKKAILELCRNGDLRERLSEKGREFVIRNFDERDAARTVLAAYEECFRSGK